MITKTKVKPRTAPVIDFWFKGQGARGTNMEILGLSISLERLKVDTSYLIHIRTQC